MVFPANVPGGSFFGSHGTNGMLQMNLNNVGRGTGLPSVEKTNRRKPSTSRQRRGGHPSDVFG
jgi:hypothetical protein